MSIVDDLNSLIDGTLERNIHELYTDDLYIYLNYTMTKFEIIRTEETDVVNIDLEFDYTSWTLTFQRKEFNETVVNISSECVYTFLENNNATHFDNALFILFLLSYVNV